MKKLFRSILLIVLFVFSSNFIQGQVNKPVLLPVANTTDVVFKSNLSPEYVAPLSPESTINVPGDFSTIQDAIDAAANGDIIQIAVGTYVENIVINKSVTINGSGIDLTIVYPAISDVGSISGPSFGNSQVMVVSAHNVIISNLTIDGDNPSLTSGNPPINGADIDARNGIIESDGPWNNLEVFNTKVKNIFLRGIYARSGGSGFNFHDNIVENVAGGYASIAIFNFGGSGIIENNTVNLANDAISANWSLGTQFLNNIVTNSSSGIHTDNNGGSGGVADLIQGNNVSNSSADGYGVWVFFPYVNTILDDNTVTNCDVGLFAWGGSGGTGTFTNNIVDGQLRPNSLGIYTTPGTDAWGSWQSNVNTTFTGNTVQNTTYAFVVESDESSPFFSNTLTVSSHPTSNNTTDIWVTGLGPIIATGLTGNSVYVTAPARISDGVSFANIGGVVNVSSGTYDESLDIQKPLSIFGEGAATTSIDRSATPTAGTVVTIHNLAGNVTFDGFTVKTGPASTVASNGIHISGLTGAGIISITNNIIWGVQSATGPAEDNFPIIAGYFSVTTPKLVLDHNIIHGGGDNPVLIEKWMGPTEITNNTLDNGIKDDEASDLIFMMNYGGSHNTQKQLISGNILDMGWGTTNQRGAGISIASSFTQVTVPGGFTDVEVTDNSFINLKPNRRGMSTWNNSDDGAGGDITNAIISGNTITNATGFEGEFGIRVLGKATGTQIFDNTISGVTDAVKIQPWNGHEATDTHVNNNSLLGATYGLNNLSTSTIDAENNWWGTAVETEIQALINGSVDYDPWIGKTNVINCTNANTNYNFLNGVIIKFTTLPSGGGNVTVMRENQIPTLFPPELTNLGTWIDLTSVMNNFSFNAMVKIDAYGLPGFDETTTAMYKNLSGEWVAIPGGAYLASDSDFGGHPSFSFVTNHFTPFTFINTPATAYNVYLSSSTTAAAGFIYPNDSWGTTGYEPPYVDWDFTAPISLYIVPAVGSVFGASDITVQWDNTMFSYVGVDFAGGIYGSVLSYYDSLRTGNQVTINAARLDNTNFNIAPGDYIAKLNLNLLKPGFGPISFTALDFRFFDGLGGQLGVFVTGNNAQVKSYLGDVASSVDTMFTGDGYIDFDDVSPWSISYWSGVGGTGLTNYKVKYDVGPTSDNTVYGTPVPDTKIQFEDLVIFSMSYGLSAGNVYPKIEAEPTEPVELQLAEPIVNGNQTTIPLYVSGGVQNVRAMSLTLTNRFGKLVSVEKGSLLSEFENPVILMHNSDGKQIYVDLAVFGAEETGINSEGEVLILVFEGTTELDLNSADIRNIFNKPMEVNISGTEGLVPAEFALLQNYPNPFNPTTTINYELPEQAMVEISIFNALGERVVTLVNEIKDAGRYSVAFNAANYSSGIYFYQIKANDFVSVKKMILMK